MFKDLPIDLYFILLILFIMSPVVFIHMNLGLFTLIGNCPLDIYTKLQAAASVCYVDMLFPLS